MALQTDEGVPFDKERLKAWRVVASVDDHPIVEAHLQATPAEMVNVGRLMNLGAIGHSIEIVIHDLGPVADEPAVRG